MRRIKLIVGFIRALAWGARYEFTHRGWRSLHRSAFGLLAAFWSLLLMKRVPRFVEEDRRDACHRCPIYCPALQTCGDARDLADPDPMGCFCFMPIKAKIKSSVCWLHEPEQAGIGGGWPKEASA